MAGAPATLSAAQVTETVQDALMPWAGVQTADLPFVTGVVINDSGKATPAADGQNTIFWNIGAPRTDMVAGKAYPMAAECDIQLQPQAPFTLLDVQAIVLHEVGHCLGLEHSAAAGVMTKFQGLPALGADDVAGASILHPGRAQSLARMTASVLGQVQRSGEPLMGAVIRIVSPAAGRVVVAGFSGRVHGQQRIDREGRFELPGIPPGLYRLHVEPMDAFVAADPDGYGAPVADPPPPFLPLVLTLPELEAGQAHDVGVLSLQAR